SAEPKETGPAKKEVTETERSCDKRKLHLRPERVSRTHQVGTPLLHARGFPLVKPSEMSPPETAMPRTRHVVDGVGIRMVISMVRNPGTRRSGSIEDCEKDQNLLDDRVEFDRTMGERTMICDRRAEPACSRNCKRT